jgi:uncharacterized protein YkwD
MTFALRSGAALAATASLLLAGAASAHAYCPGEDLPASAQSDVAIEKSLLCVINERRAQSGAPPVAHNAKLATAAQRHAGDMVSRGYFSHTAPGGTDFIDRIAGTGYTQGVRYWLVGENLAWGSGSLSTPSQLVQAWMDSPSHRQNLLRDRYREVGLGAVSGTPSDAKDADGVTVVSEYGYRTGKHARRAVARKARKARAAKRRAARRAARARRARAA